MANTSSFQYDVVVIGGGPAGLQAALTLGRMHRPTLMLDSGSYRNAPVDAMHNIITNDGRHPAVVGPAPVAGLRARGGAGMSTDVVVVGSGIAGLTAALGLSDHGLAVTLVTKTVVASGSTRWALVASR